MTGQDDLDRAAALLEVERADQAREIIVRVMAGDPGSVRAACLLASSFRVSRDWGAMRAAAEHACALAPEHSWAHQLRSVALGELGHHVSAVAAARQAVKLAPENPSPLVNLVETLLDQNTATSRRQAQRAADRALRLAPTRGDVRRANARVHVRLRDTGKARGLLHAALADDPTDTRAQVHLAALDVRDARLTRAAWRLAAIAAGDPTSPLGLRALQVVATQWLRHLYAAVSVLYAVAVPVGAAPIPDRVRIPVAIGLAAAGVTAIAWRLQRLPPTARRMVARPAAVAAPFNWSQRTARRAHVRLSVYIVLLVGMSSLAIAIRGRNGVWILLWALAATVALRGLAFAIRALVDALRLIDRRQERLERRLRRDAARGRYPTVGLLEPQDRVAFPTMTASVIRVLSRRVGSWRRVDRTHRRSGPGSDT